MFRKLKTLIGGAALALGLSMNAPGAGAVELTMYYPVAVGGPLTKIVDGLVADFMKANPGIKVNAIYAGNYNDARIKALAALKSGKPAQLSVMFSIDIYELIEQGAIVAFDDIVETPEEKAWLKKFYPSLMENGMTQGKVWGIPFQRSTIVMYYNKDAFRDAGLDPAKAPATWDELVSMGKKLVKKSGGQTVRWGAMIPSTGYPYWMFGALTKQNGQVLMNADGNKTFFDAPATVEALQFWRDLGNKHGVMPSGTIEWGTLRKNFLEGKTAIMWHSTGNLTVVKNKAKFDFGVAMLPAKKSRGTPTGGGNFYIFKKSSPAERKAAMKLIRFLTEPGRTAEWSMKTGYIGTRPDAYQTEALKKYVAGFPPAAVARDQLKFATAELSTYQTGRVRKLLDDAIQAALVGKKSPQDALGSAQKQADRLLKRYR
ncbi:MAG: ABC transporter substrate-binding protein [Rhodospirillaceae bacterium]|nr:ABC transporter substrate-binding protein [Rhodospirillaceae bacterium]MXW91931.1 ABC transporter substrate-binding protein [Rhodospirillaceae bacterium]MYB15264.1 ABC transporter substrate-binding protein [Rhodospirillaceae bacterium]MYI50725.1 ABC transporter substrate-binding protein [Rhodospirillaceae bacterium]